jgi:acyl carrier protein
VPRLGRPASGAPAEGADLRLIGYVVPRPGASPGAQSLAEFVRARLPEVMIPAAFMTLGELPLTPHGKVDRRALPDPADEIGAARSRTAPRTPTEERLAEIWREVLGVRQVGIEDNFLALGGHSLLAMKLITRIRSAFAIDLPLRALYETANLEELGVAIANAQAAQADSALLAELLDELEQMHPDEIQVALTEEKTEP